MNNPIDIVVTYVDQNDKFWQKEFKEWKQKELNNGSNKETNNQAFGEDRYRDWETLKYWFRGVEANCKWVNKVVFIVAYPSQIPKWLNVNNQKIKIVYHKDFIPKELLPTFNTNTIELFIPNIKELSNNYILCNDDFYFISPLSEGVFFQRNIPVNSCLKRKPVYYDTNNEDIHYLKMLNNDIEIIKDYSGEVDYRYSLVHLPVAKNKDIELDILNNHYDKIIKALSTSKFRSDNDYTRGIYEDSAKFMKKVIIDNDMYNNSKYVALKSKIDYNKLKHLDMVCLNDTTQVDNFELAKERQLMFFQSKFPDISEYEIQTKKAD